MTVTVDWYVLSYKRRYDKNFCGGNGDYVVQYLHGGIRKNKKRKRQEKGVKIHEQAIWTDKALL